MTQEMKSYPLTWPAGWKRSPFTVHSKFGPRQRGVSVMQAVTFLLKQLKQMGIEDWNVIISTNLKLRNDGWPRSDQSEPLDRGVAVWWRDGKNQRVIALDKYSRVACNLWAVGKTIEALRGIDRWGSGEILQRTFTGFDALPPPTKSQTWWEVFGCDKDAGPEHVNAAYKKARWRAHPDTGGSSEAFNAVQDAWAAYCKERGLQP